LIAALIFGAVAIYLGVNERVYDVSTLGRRPGGLFLRKGLSVLVFAVAGMFGVALAAPQTPRWVKRLAAAAGGGFLLSSAIEFFQYPEPAADILLDLACGLVGGSLGYGALRWLDKIFGRRRGPHSCGPLCSID
jgi:hypothetical protein